MGAMMNDEDKPKMVLIPGGVMPDTKAATYRADYSGQQVDSFEIGKYAITVAEWVDTMDYLPDNTEHLSLEHPITNVNWYDAQRYIEQLNKVTGEHYRLPTELEWEYAARAGSSYIYHIHRNTLLQGKVVNYEKNNKGPITVGSMPPNGWGCYEMLGNVWEWVSDGGRTELNFHDKEYELKVLRGGCWASSEFEVTLTARDEHEKGTNGWNSFGFRIAKTIT